MFKNYRKLKKHILETDFLHCLLIFTNHKIFESADRKTSSDFENSRKRRNHERKNALLGNWKVSLARQSFLDLLCCLRNSTRGAEILKYISNESRA